MTKSVRLIFLVIVSSLAAHGVAGADAKPATILFYGDSLTAGYGLDDPTETAFPALIADRIEAAGLPYRVINAGLSGETSSGGLRRINWVLRQPVDVFVLELGANDGLRGLPLDLLRTNLQQIIDRVRAKNPDVRLVIAGMQMPTSMGEYAPDFAAIYPDIAAANDAALIPFLLEGVGGVTNLNQSDGIHPTPAGHEILAATVWQTLQPLLATP
ncbi:arylesterase [Synoicihabitans lomoniglobus]|uniref:Arylesterase n=1 Tax=Synoicihabitans lomoniglobus TaxID=2909285 RepID=A0AAE9ZXK7_9BACT|nr:arylesterase [Opitutaceae bacterium LMO-M01]WED64765.1 arylesterase [Opitutaceae bacterium LMO-M01]